MSEAKLWSVQILGYTTCMPSRFIFKDEFWGFYHILSSLLNPKHIPTTP
ncbi:hypothetical protein LINPERPRIM_LOCUS26464 [Linum perenne]